MSEFSRETLLNIIETDHVQCGDASALARMALAAMDSSESVELPLDYLQGHKDGLEWAAQLAEANHPETGDWLYDDPIELAKAIRKGPDMPPAQPVADSEPVAWLLSGGGAKNVVVFDGGNAYADPLREVTPLYRHAQPAPVSYSDFEEFWSAYIHPLAQDDELKGFAWDIWSVLGSNSQPAPVVPEEVTAEDCPALVKYDVTEVDEAWARGFNSCRAAMLNQAQAPATDNTAQQFEALATSKAKPTAALKIPDGLHPDTADLVMRFATALAEKLHRAEQKYGHANGWKAPGWYNECLQQLWEHIEKGDPRDVAAYCAFMWHHGWVTTDYDRNVQNACRAAMLSGGKS